MSYYQMRSKSTLIGPMAISTVDVTLNRQGIFFYLSVCSFADGKPRKDLYCTDSMTVTCGLTNDQS